MRLLLHLIILSAALSCSDERTSKSRRFNSQISVDGRTRTFLLNLPPAVTDGNKIPLVVILHGFGGAGSQAERDYGWTEKGDREKFAVVYPDGVQSAGRFALRSWNAGTCCHYAVGQNVDDVKFISEMVDHIADRYPIDRSKVYVAGMSNGGMMAYQLACESADLFAAVASVSGPFTPESICAPSRAIPVLHIHSLADAKVPPDGGRGLGGFYFPPVDSGLLFFQQYQHCQTFQEQSIPGKYLYRKWSNCSDDSEVQSYTVYDGGHSWPGGKMPTPRSDQPSTALAATDVIWAFFSSHSR